MPFIRLNSSYYEIIDSESPSTSEFSQTNSKSVITFLVTQAQLTGTVDDKNRTRNFLTDVLGSAYLTNNSYVSREVPASHPLFPWQYASRIVSVKGYSPMGNERSDLITAAGPYANIEVKQPSWAGAYQYYKIVVEFQSRNYNIYTDAQLVPHYEKKQIWMPQKSNRGLLSETNFEINDRMEYLRYCTWTYEAKTEPLTYGGTNFWCKNSAEDDNDNLQKEFPVPADNGGVNNLLITRYNIDYNWYFVPFELTLKNQMWVDGYNKINQYPFIRTQPNLNTEFSLFKRGSLLFKEVKVKKYEPYWPFEKILVTDNSSVYDWQYQYSKNQYCDITFKFVMYEVPENLKIIPGRNTYKQLNCKNVQSAHNMVPYPATLNYYYFESSNDKEKGAPLYWSYPFEALFLYREGA